MSQQPSVPDEDLPEDLRPSDDNPLAQPAGDDVPDDVLTESAGPSGTSEASDSSDASGAAAGGDSEDASQGEGDAS